MNKRFYAVAVLAIALILPILMLSNYVNTEADSPESGVDGDFSYTYEGTNATITGYTGSLSVIEIPGTVNGKTVFAIGNDAFAENTSLTSVTIGNNTIFLGERAFSRCANLNSVFLGNGMESISNRAFSECTSLTSIDIPDSARILGDEVFSQCTSLTSVTIGNQVTNLGSKIFSQCTSLTSVTIGANVEYIGYKAFSECTSLTSIDIPSNVRNLGDMVFSQCTNLTSVTTGDGVKSISSGAFLLCTSLTSVTMGSEVKRIETGAFWDCTSLTSVIIGNSVIDIDAGAFRNCTNLESVTVGNSVLTIGPDVFRGCDSLIYIRFLGGAPAVGDGWAPSDIKIFYYLSNSGSFDETATGWDDKTLGVLPYGVILATSIADIPDQTYTGSPVEPDFIVSLDGIVLVKGIDYWLSYSDNIDVRTVTVTVTGVTPYTGSTTKDFEIIKKKVTVTPDDGQSKVYGETDPVLTYTLSEAISVSGHLTRVTGENVRTYAIEIDALASVSNNYELILAATDFTITKAPLTVTAEDKSVTFTQAAPDFTATYSGFVDGEDESVLEGALDFICTYSGSAYAATFTIEPSGLTSANYEITFTEGTLSVAKASTPVPKAASPAYDGTPQNGVIGSPEYTLTGHTATDVGNYTATATLNGGYIWSGGSADPEEISWTMAPMTVTVIPDAMSKVYGQTDPVITYTLSEPISVTGSLSRAAGENAGTYAMTLGSLEPASGNYVLTLAPSNFEIASEGTEDMESEAAKIDTMILLEIGAVIFAVVIAAMVLSRQ